jgi:hypothetical protein
MGGALMGLAAQVVSDPHAQNFAGAQTQGWAKIKFDISDLNPIKLIYDEVKQQVVTDANRPVFPAAPVLTPDFSKMDAQIKLNNDKFQGMNRSGNISDLPESDPR